ncbi:MAG: threonylcarbamoyl-AMP synthase [Deltaproteobacteria bacterium]|nr:threonylcarbamoyl-AMP synthase [Deltaproteobacteria bacterium]
MERVTTPKNIVTLQSDETTKTALYKAKQVLLSGGIVAFPTESFYGLAVDIENERAIEKLFALKQRDKNNPVLILLPEITALKEYVEEIPDQAVKMINAFWPGGLTMIFKANRKISHLLTANTGKIGIRYSSHPVATALAGSIGRPVTGTSSNISGYAPCNTADEVFENLGEKVDLILDNGATPGGKGSTILDITATPPVFIREGIVLQKDIEKIIKRD